MRPAWRFGRKTEQLVIIAGFLPRHWLYAWFSQFHSCGTYSVLSRGEPFNSKSVPVKTPRATYQCRSVFVSMSVPQHVVRQRSVGRNINSRPGVEFHRRLSPRQPPNVRENAHNWKSDDCVDDRFHAVQKWPLAKVRVLRHRGCVP